MRRHDSPHVHGNDDNRPRHLVDHNRRACRDIACCEDKKTKIMGLLPLRLHLDNLGVAQGRNDNMCGIASPPEADRNDTITQTFLLTPADDFVAGQSPPHKKGIFYRHI